MKKIEFNHIINKDTKLKIPKKLAIIKALKLYPYLSTAMPING